MSSFYKTKQNWQQIMHWFDDTRYLNVRSWCALLPNALTIACWRYPSYGLLLIIPVTWRVFQANFIPNWSLIPPLCMSCARAQAGSDCGKGHDETSYDGIWSDLGCRDRARQGPRGSMARSWKQDGKFKRIFKIWFFLKNIYEYEYKMNTRHVTGIRA